MSLPISCQVFLLLFLFATFSSFLFLWSEMNIQTQFKVISSDCGPTSRTNGKCYSSFPYYLAFPTLVFIHQEPQFIQLQSHLLIYLKQAGQSSDHNYRC